MLLMTAALKHGTRYTYVKHKCHCPECKEANSEYKRNKTAHYRSIAEAEAPENLRTANGQKVTHGLPSTYEWYGCKCKECSEAEANEKEFRQAVKV
jgi:hypothetical protein